MSKSILRIVQKHQIHYIIKIIISKSISYVHIN
jgi:hypothetical protein